jgi:hypothetical protein
LPILTVARTAFDKAGRPMEFLETVNNPEMMVFLYEKLPLGRPAGRQR